MQVSQETRNLTKKLSQEFSKTMSGILGAPSKLYEILFSPKARVPMESMISKKKNQGTKKDRSGIYPDLEKRVSLSRTSQEFSPRRLSTKWLEFTKKVHTSPLERLQARKGIAFYKSISVLQLNTSATVVEYQVC